MRENEKKLYLIGMAVISAIGLLVLLLFFSSEIKRLDRIYTFFLTETVIKVEKQLSNQKSLKNTSKNTLEPQAQTDKVSTENLVTEYLEREGYIDQQISHISNGKLLDWNRWIMFTIVFICLLFFLQSFWGLWGFHCIYKQIDRGEELLAEIIGEHNETTKISPKWEQWKEQCEKAYNCGAIGRLYGEIWETAQIIHKNATEQKQEQKYLKDMMSDISHQIKTPLASLQLFVDIFEKEISNSHVTKHQTSKHSIEDLTDQAKLQIKRIRWLVTGILKLAQIESGSLLMDYQISPVILTLENSIAALHIKLMEKNQQVKLFGDREILLKQDVNWLQEAFLNILKNASEYAPENSNICVSMEQTSMAIVIAIEDKGPGIPEKELPKIFNRFYRIPSKEHTDGVGIGLALAKSIIERQGGLVSVFSQTGQASYTKFVITFLTKP